MEPKDLKNSEELKSTKKDDLEKSESKKSVKEEVKKTEEKAEAIAETKVEETKEESTEELKAETAEEEKPELKEKTVAVEEKAEEVKADVAEEKPATEKVEEEVEKEEPAAVEEEKPKSKEETVVVEEKAEEVKVDVAEEKPAAKKVEEPVEKAEPAAKEEEKPETKEETVLVEKKAEEVKADVTEEKPVAKKAEEPVKKAEPATVEEETVAVEKEVVETKAEETVVEVKEESKKVEEEKSETPVAEEKVEEPEPIKESAKEPKKEETTAKAEVTKDKAEPAVAIVKDVKPKKKEPVDYSNHSQVELVNAMRDVLEENDDHDIKDEVETIKAVFYKNLNETIEAAKKKFVDEGGEEKEFKAEDDPYEKDIKDLLRKYRQLRFEYSKRMEANKEENLKLKYQVIEDIKGLINNEESINKTFNDFRDLQHKWREIGLVPQSKMKNLWDTYHFHVENFYDYIKINRELRDLDLKKNLEIKIKLCENAEELLVEPSIIKAFNTLQKYHERWREVGPVPREQKDDIWERFKAATSKINKKHQEFFETRKEEQKKNLEAKTALCEKVEEIKIEEVHSYSDWDVKSKELVELQKIWRTIGFAPKKDNNRIYERFRTACDTFFNAKREFYAKNKEIQQNNLQLKIDLCVQAESLKDSTDWKKTTQDFINIQKRWKEIGPIPRKHSDNVWKRFRAACDFFFDKKSEHFSSIDTEYIDNLKLKEELIEEVLKYESAGDVDENLKSLKNFQRRWTEVGHVPFKKKDEVQNKFRDAINKLFDDLNIDEEKRNLLKFRSKMNSYSESNRGQSKMRMERDKYMSKLKQLENDLTLLDNNIGFFAKSKNAESLIADVNKKIEMTKQKIELLKEKIRVIDDVDK